MSLRDVGIIISWGSSSRTAAQRKAWLDSLYAATGIKAFTPFLLGNVGSTSPPYQGGYNAGTGEFDINLVVAALEDPTDVLINWWGPEIYLPDGEGLYLYDRWFNIDVEDDVDAGEYQAHMANVKAILPNADLTAYRNPEVGAGPGYTPVASGDAMVAVTGSSNPVIYPAPAGNAPYDNATWMIENVKHALDITPDSTHVLISSNRSRLQTLSASPAGWGDFDGVPFVPGDTMLEAQITACQAVMDGAVVKDVIIWEDSPSGLASGQPDLEALYEDEDELLETIFSTCAYIAKRLGLRRPGIPVFDGLGGRVA